VGSFIFSSPAKRTERTKAALNAWLGALAIAVLVTMAVIIAAFASQ